MVRDSSVQRTALETVLAQLQPPRLTDTQILALAFLLPQEMFLSALELVDAHSVSRITSPYGSKFYTVSGSSHPYLLSPASPAHCPCPAFAFSLVSASGEARAGGDQWEGMCKHLLALKIALRLDAVVEERLDDGERSRGEDRMLALLGQLGLAG